MNFAQLRIIAISLLIGIVVGSNYAHDFILEVFMLLPRTEDDSRWSLLQGYPFYHFVLKWSLALVIVQIGCQVQQRFSRLQNMRYIHRMAFHPVRNFMLTPGADPRRDFLWSFLYTVAGYIFCYVGGCLALIPFQGMVSAFGDWSSFGIWVSTGFLVWLLVTGVRQAPFFGEISALTASISLMSFVAFVFLSYRGPGGGLGFCIATIFLACLFVVGTSLAEVIINIVFADDYEQLEDELSVAPYLTPLYQYLQELRRKQ